MEGHSSTGQSSQWAVVSMEKEEEEECRPSSGCLKNLLGDYTISVVILGKGRDLVLHHKSWD